MANPFYVDPTGGFNTGAGISQALGSVAGAVDRYKATQKQEQQQARLNQGKEAIFNAYQSNDPDKIAEAMIQYPELSDVLGGAIDFRSDATRQNMVESAKQIVANPQAAEQILTQRINMIQAEGGDPSDSIAALQDLKEDPDQFLQNAKNLFASYDPQGYKAYASAQPEREETLTPYQSAQIELKKEDQRLREIESQISQETNDLKRQKLQADVELQQAKVKDAQLKSEAAQGSKQASFDMATEASKVAREIANDDSFSDIVGTIASRTPTLSGKSQDLINKANRLQSLLTVDNLKLMTGVLTDRDISFLTNVASGLNVTENGIKGSEKGVKKRLLDIANRIDEKLKSQGGGQQTVNWSDLQ